MRGLVGCGGVGYGSMHRVSVDMRRSTYSLLPCSALNSWADVTFNHTSPTSTSTPNQPSTQSINKHYKPIELLINPSIHTPPQSTSSIRRRHSLARRILRMLLEDMLRVRRKARLVLVRLLLGLRVAALLVRVRG